MDGLPTTGKKRKVVFRVTPEKDLDLETQSVEACSTDSGSIDEAHELTPVANFRF